MSFDVVKRWLETGEKPNSQYIRFFMTWLLTFFFAFVWMYQEVVPKIMMSHPEEVAMIKQTFGLATNQAEIVVLIIGCLEVIFGIIWLLFRYKHKLFMLQVILFPLLTIGAVIAQPSNVVHPFNPIVLNSALFVLSILGMMVCKNIPTSKNCKRKRTGE